MAGRGGRGARGRFPAYTRGQSSRSSAWRHSRSPRNRIGSLSGSLRLSLRSHADGCDPSHCVGYIEGWYVAPPYRRNRIGARLVAAAEEWARTQGCREIASDVWLSNPKSQIAHEALGFEVVDRCVHYRKRPVAIRASDFRHCAWIIAFTRFWRTGIPHERRDY